MASFDEASVQRHVSAYDLFALLVPGATTLALLVAWIGLAHDLPTVPASLLYATSAVGALLSFYLVGHCLEGANSSAGWRWWPAWAKYIWHGEGKRVYHSKLVLDPNGKLGPEFVAGLFDRVNKLFHSKYDSAKPEHRYTVFMLCSAYLEQHGDTDRSFRMQTLHRLCVSLQSIFRWTTWAFLLALPIMYTIHQLYPEWFLLGLRTPTAFLLGTSIAAGFVSSVMAFRFHQKARQYDEYFVLNIVRGFAARSAVQD